MVCGVGAFAVRFAMYHEHFAFLSMEGFAIVTLHSPKIPYNPLRLNHEGEEPGK